MLYGARALALAALAVLMLSGCAEAPTYTGPATVHGWIDHSGGKMPDHCSVDLIIPDHTEVWLNRDDCIGLTMGLHVQVISGRVQ